MDNMLTEADREDILKFIDFMQREEVNITHNRMLNRYNASKEGYKELA
jgi:hypothetical protein